MLMLSRYKEESIRIGDDIEIKVLDVRGNTVKIGIQAPEGVTVHRQEIYDIIKAEEDETDA